MAVLTPELQRELLRNELENEQRAATKAAILRDEKNARELNAIENAALIAGVNKLMAGRDAWLKQLRDAKTKELNRALTLAEEQDFEAEVRAAMLDPARRRSVANFKYQSDAAADPKNANKTGLEGMLSNFTSQLGLGDNPIFNFLGKLFAFIMNLIKGVKETFNPEKVPADSVADLVKEGSFDDADAELTKQEHALINKLRSVTDKDGKEHAEIKAAVDMYEAKLTELKELKIRTEDAHDKYVPFAETTEAHKKNILRSRIKIFNEISSKMAPVLATHEEAVAVGCQEKLKRQQADQLTRERNAANDGAHPLELKSLEARLAAVNAEMETLVRKRQDADREEAAFNTAMGVANGAGQIGFAFEQNRALLEAEEATQVALDTKAKTNAREAAQAARDELAHRRAVEIERARHPA